MEEIQEEKVKDYSFYYWDSNTLEFEEMHIQDNKTFDEISVKVMNTILNWKNSEDLFLAEDHLDKKLKNELSHAYSLMIKVEEKESNKLPVFFALKRREFMPLFSVYRIKENHAEIYHRWHDCVTNNYQSDFRFFSRIHDICHLSGDTSDFYTLIENIDKKINTEILSISPHMKYFYYLPFAVTIYILLSGNEYLKDLMKTKKEARKAFNSYSLRKYPTISAMILHPYQVMGNFPKSVIKDFEEFKKLEQQNIE